MPVNWSSASTGSTPPERAREGPPAPSPCSAPGEGRGRFTGDRLRGALAEVCQRLRLDPSGARLLRFTNNAVFSLASAPVVVRIVGSRALAHRASKVVQLAHHLQAHGVPAVRLLPGVAQPMHLGEDVATVWRQVPAGGGQPAPADLAVMLRSLHALPPPAGFPRWSPLTDVRARISDAEALGAGDREFLLRRCDDVQRRLDALDWPLPPALMHGDAHPGNLIMGSDGPVICDFDSSCVGPPEWDLTPLAVGAERFGDPPGRYAELAEHYGFDVTRWDGFAVLREARELKLTTSALPILRSRPGVAGELRRRLDDLRAGRAGARWSRYR
jgi:aminoglycoside phosphotransferase (APT) family kinase protein